MAVGERRLQQQVFGRAGVERRRIVPLPAGMRHRLEALARDGRWTDLHAWADRLAADPHHAPLVQAVRLALESLDFDRIRQ